MERPLHTRAGFWVGALGPVLLTVLVLIEFNKSHAAAPNVAGYGALVLGFFGVVVLGIAWLWVMLQSRAWLASMAGAALGGGSRWLFSWRMTTSKARPNIAQGHKTAPRNRSNGNACCWPWTLRAATTQRESTLHWR